MLYFDCGRSWTVGWFEVTQALMHAHFAKPTQARAPVLMEARPTPNQHRTLSLTGDPAWRMV